MFPAQRPSCLCVAVESLVKIASLALPFGRSSRLRNHAGVLKIVGDPDKMRQTENALATPYIANKLLRWTQLRNRAVRDEAEGPKVLVLYARDVQYKLARGVAKRE